MDDKWFSYINMESFWTQLLPLLEEYWVEGENVPRGYVKQFPFEVRGPPSQPPPL